MKLIGGSKTLRPPPPPRPAISSVRFQDALGSRGCLIVMPTSCKSVEDPGIEISNVLVGCDR